MTTYERYKQDARNLERLTETIDRAQREAERGATYVMTLDVAGRTYRVATRDGSTPQVTVEG